MACRPWSLCRSRIITITPALTLPLQDPEKLSQLLRQRASSDNSHPLHFTTSTEEQQSFAYAEAVTAQDSPHRDPSSLQAPAAQPTRDPPLRRVTNRTNYAKPSLPKHQSAPTSTGFVMEREGGERMIKSFNEVMDLPGDTQPDSQIYKNWTSVVLGTGSNDGLRATTLLNPVEEEDVDTPTDGAEAIGSSQEQHSPTITSPTVILDDGTETQLRVGDILTSPLKFETPAMAGRKRNNQGQILSSAMQTVTTPGTALTAAAFFPAGTGDGGMGHGMSLTQIFNATQAGTSPVVGAASDDVVFQRPSPNFTNARNSSPVHAMSSPIKPPRADPPIRSSSEPRAEYITMKQSQDRRSRELDIETSPAVEEDSWDRSPSPNRERDMEKRKKRFNEKYAQSFKQVTAPAKSSPPRQRRKGHTLLSMSVTSNLKTPARSRLLNRSARSGNQSGAERDEPTPPIPANGIGDNDDSPDELSQGVPLSTRPTPVNHMNKLETKVQVPNTSSLPRRTLSGRAVRSSPPGSPSAQVHRESQVRSSGSQPIGRGSRPKSSKELLTIMDSQPDTIADLDSIPKPRSLLLPSSPSTNQYSINQTTIGGRTGYTSQVVSSSMPPMPPRSSSPILGDRAENKNSTVENEERVPSSPPPLNDDDIVYDEHHYDEHHSARESDGELEHEYTMDCDLNVAGDDGVPELEYARNEEEGAGSGKYRRHHGDGKDLEGPEAAQLHDMSELRTEEDDLVRSSHPEDEQGSAIPKPGNRSIKRQSTVPESDMMDDTQSSFFPYGAPGEEYAHVAESALEDRAAPNQTHSTEPFHSACENQSTFQSGKTSNENGQGAMSVELPQYRSLTDIANQPETQTSTDMANLDIPQLSFVDEMHDEFNAIMSGSSPVRPATKKRKVTYTKKKTFSSPAKDPKKYMKQPPLSPLKQVQQALEDTPPSSMEQEEQGALAATNAREDAISANQKTMRLGVSTRRSKAKSEKKGALKPVNKALLPKARPKSKVTRRSAYEKSPSRSPNIEEDKVSNVEMADAEVSTELLNETSASALQRAEPKARSMDAPTSVDANNGRLLIPNRIIAFWPGLGYYPATCLGRLSASRLQFRYDDGTINDLDAVHVRALDLRIGDHVKVDETGMKKHTYVVVGFKDRIDTNHKEEYPSTDRQGYATLLLEIKQRDNLPTAQPQEQQEAIAVPVEKIYLTNQLWAKFRDRVYTFSLSASPSTSTSRITTPTSAANRSGTPSMSRRGTVGPSLLKEPIRAESVTPSLREETVFANMAFAITLTQDYSEKEMVTQLITANGGYVLNEGFHELFQGMFCLSALSISLVIVSSSLPHPLYADSCYY